MLINSNTEKCLSKNVKALSEVAIFFLTVENLLNVSEQENMLNPHRRIGHMQFTNCQPRTKKANVN